MRAENSCWRAKRAGLHLLRALPALRGEYFVRPVTNAIRRDYSHGGQEAENPMSSESFEGGCTCRAVRYRMTSRPMFVNCCHCRWCQRETGTAFALNAMIEADRVVLLEGKPEFVNTPSNSGKGQIIARCPSCHIALWSNYGGGGDRVRFVRVGTLDAPDNFPP